MGTKNPTLRRMRDGEQKRRQTSEAIMTYELRANLSRGWHVGADTGCEMLLSPLGARARGPRTWELAE
jgi:hypothetical protein